jgi:hypothetical protein
MTDRLETQHSILFKRAIKNAAAQGVSDIAEFRKIRDTTLDSLSSQPQNFNFCNFFFKTSGTNSSSGESRIRLLFVTHTADLIVYRYSGFRQYPFFEKLKKILFFSNPSFLLGLSFF